MSQKVVLDSWRIKHCNVQSHGKTFTNHSTSSTKKSSAPQCMCGGEGLQMLNLNKILYLMFWGLFVGFFLQNGKILINVPYEKCVASVLYMACKQPRLTHLHSRCLKKKIRFKMQDGWKGYIFVILESKNHNLFIKMCSAFAHWLFIWSIMTRTVLPCISHRCRVKVSVLVCCKCQYWSCIYLVSDQNQNLQYGIALMHNTLIRLDVAYS